MALTLKSQRQIQAEILSQLISQLGLNDINPGSVIDVLTQAVAQQDFALYYQIAQVSRLVDIGTLSGDDLDNKGFEYGLTRSKAQKSKGLVTIYRQASFVKISTSFYAGSPAPISGQSTIDVNDASSPLIGTSGTLILGRGTNNEEEVAYTVAPANMTTFWTFTLTSPLTKDHAVEETVILKQGVDEVILAGTTIVVPPSGVNAEIQFQVDTDTVLLSGEDRIDEVEITAIEAGETGNIPIGAINGELAFTSAPFAGARARNNSKFTTGRDLETDDAFRDRIVNYVQGISKAVKQAILNAIVGAVDPETAKRVVSASVVLPVETVGDVKVYIDDGLGFEPSFTHKGFEEVLNSSTGGEQRLQVDNFPVVKAQIESNKSEPYDMSGSPLTLIYEVGTIQETITFNSSDFSIPSIATAEELTAAINAKSTLIEARTSQVGTFVLITAKADANEDIQIIGGTSNSIISFPLDRKETISLYIDDLKKSKDGQTATLDSGNSSPYNLAATGGFPQYLNVVVDGKTANPLVATFQSSDAVNTALVTTKEIVKVLNRDLVGVVATSIDNNTKIRLESLTKLSSSSKVHVTGGTLNNVTHGLNFSTVEAVGVDGDYKFNRELGIIELASPLVANQQVTIGSLFTRGKIRSVTPEPYFPNNLETLVISVDGGGDQTITFDSSFATGKSAADTATFINASLKGATAIVREIGGINYLEINTNTYKTDGSIQIKSSSTSNAAFEFPLDTLEDSIAPNKAYTVSGQAGPYNFAQNDSLIAVVDNNIVDNTFSILMNFAGSVTATTSTTVFRDFSLTSIFPNSTDLIDFYIAFKSGLNTVSGTINTVADQGGGVFRYSFGTAPLTFGIIAAGDLFNIQGLDNSDNNGYFVIQNVGADYVDVSNANGVAATGQTGTAILSQRRRITAYSHTTGQLTVGVAFNSTPVISDTLIVVPSTITNLVNYINNTKITSFSLKGIVEGAENNTKLQLSSKSLGSDGYIQVTGGNANTKLVFDTTLFRGIQAYSYWIGLLALVHKIIYGDDKDLASFPGTGAAGIIFRILAPTVRQLSIQLRLTLQEGVSISSLENEVRSAVTGYVNTLGVGDDIIIERIRAAVISIPGITDVVIDNPTQNIAIADNEKAFVSDTDILIG